MKTYLDCIPCFFRQALEASRMAGVDEEDQRKILIELGRMLSDLSFEATPPEMAYRIHKRIQEVSRCPDPYRKIKEESNRMALALYPKLTERIHASDLPLYTAVELASLGNIIDYGALHHEMVQGELDRKLANFESKKEETPIFAWGAFAAALSRAEDIVYLADNAGETVFDRLLIETIREFHENKKITYAVRHEPILNDATREDAKVCGLETSAEIVSSGSRAPGAVLSECYPEFVAHLRRADMIISKGQGNFEALSDQRLPIFFLFVAKCPVIARDASCRVGEALLLPGRNTTFETG